MAQNAKYLVGYDGGELSMRAAELAVEKLVAKGGGTLMLVYVVDWSEFEVMSVEELAVRHSQQMEQLESAEKDIMEPAKAKLATDGITIKSFVQVGHSAEVISALAAEQKADQIFIGHKSSGLLAKLGLGSVAYGILQKAKVPVTVVP
ncbi:universal stress protein [Paremcibacter congregatus]|uniref:Universal stress protein n=1 Tax=Paremcibacter congregatus TaxID=2043170 RepID=A0A2G4YQ03_9PROT|nr:universal stress protein [Paremcibacter congregatus]PHZ84377.1 universal stress protein [Paremcibacter congregatus]QDE28596.1 universal stress protein [Paremcibacter congregatus]